MDNTLAKKQLKLSLPMAFENFITTLMSLIDTVVVANLGVKYLTAIGAISVVINILQIIPQSFSISNVALITKTEDDKIQKKYLSNSINLCFYFSILCIIITLAISPVIPSLFNIDKIGNIYLYIRLAGFIQASLATIMYGYLRVNGKQNIVLAIQVISVIANLILDIVACFVGGGLIGVALSTIAIETISMVICFMHIKWNTKIKLEKTESKDILNLFKWNFTERIISKVDYFVFNILVSRMGTNEYAVHTVFIQINDTMHAFVQGYSDGFAISIGKINNEEELKNSTNIFKKMFFYSTIIFTFLMIAVSLIVIFISFKDQSLIYLSLELLPFLILTTILLTLGSYYFSHLRGIRKFKFLAIRNLISSFLKIVIATILSFTILGIFGVWTAHIVYHTSQYIISRIYFDKLNRKPFNIKNTTL